MEREHFRFTTQREAEVVAKDQVILVAWRRWIDGPILYEKGRER